MRKKQFNYLLFALAFFGMGVLVGCTDDAGTLPKAATADVTDIKDLSATAGGSVEDNGESTIVATGLCWSATSPEPTTADSYVSVGKYTTQGILEDEWNFTATMTGLEPTTKYYVRAYVANEVGVAYGEVKEFETKAGKIFHALTNDMIEVFTQELYEGPKESLVDGDLTTYWHSAWSNSEGYENAPLPHHIQINFDESKAIGGFTYWFRNPSGATDRPTQFDLQVSADGDAWTTVWTSEENLPYTWADDAEYEQGRTLTFGENHSSQYFRLRILQTVGNRDWTHLAEIKVFEDGSI